MNTKSKPSCAKRFCPLISSQFADVMNAPFFGHPPPVAHSLAPFPISDCGCRLHLPRGLPVCILEAEAADIFLPPSNPFMNSLLCGEAPLKAASVPASMCALYSCVCVYASASYGCFPPPGPGLGVGAAVHLNVASVRISSPARCRDRRMCNDIAGILAP